APAGWGAGRRAAGVAAERVAAVRPAAVAVPAAAVVLAAAVAGLVALAQRAARPPAEPRAPHLRIRAPRCRPLARPTASVRRMAPAMPVRWEAPTAPMA